MGPTHPRVDSPGNQPHPAQADLGSRPVQFHTILLKKNLEFSFSSLMYPVNAFIQALLQSRHCDRPCCLSTNEETGSISTMPREEMGSTEKDHK